MKVLAINVNGNVQLQSIDESDKLTALQELVGGNVERITLTEHTDLLFNEEGKFEEGHKANRIAGRLLRHFDIPLEPGDYIAGNAAIVGTDGPEWISAPDSAADTLAFLGFEVTQEDEA